jgi:membrane associated rhomboid family serine protease
MFPLRDDNPTFLIPYATYAIIGLNVLAWAVLQGFGASPALESSLCRLGLIPGELLHLAAVGTRVALGPNAVCVLSDSGPWYTVVTSMFMHGSWMHIIGNMWFLWIFGDNVEDAMGSVRFAFFYLLCGLAAAGLQIFSDATSIVPMVGASGAIGGVMGAYILLYPRVHVHMLIFLGFFVTTVAVPAIFMLGYWFLIQLVSGLATDATTGGVAFWAHVGGFAAGAGLIFIFRNPELLARHPYRGWSRSQGPNRPWRRIDR